MQIRRFDPKILYKNKRIQPERKFRCSLKKEETCKCFWKIAVLKILQTFTTWRTAQNAGKILEKRLRRSSFLQICCQGA